MFQLRKYESQTSHRVLLEVSSTHRCLELVRKIKDLGGHYLGSKSFVKTATHLVTDTVRCSEKFLAACSKGLWILPPKYVDDSFEVGMWLEELDYEYSTTQSNQSSDLIAAAKRWRWRVNKYNEQPFSGLHVGLFSQPRSAVYERLLAYGGAKVYHIPWPTVKDIKITEISYIFLDLSSREQATSLYEYGFICLHFKFIIDTIIKDEVVDLINYVVGVSSDDKDLIAMDKELGMLTGKKTVAIMVVDSSRNMSIQEIVLCSSQRRVSQEIVPCSSQRRVSVEAEEEIIDLTMDEDEPDLFPETPTASQPGALTCTVEAADQSSNPGILSRSYCPGSDRSELENSPQRFAKAKSWFMLTLNSDADQILGGLEVSELKNDTPVSLSKSIYFPSQGNPTSSLPIKKQCFSPMKRSASQPCKSKSENKPSRRKKRFQAPILKNTLAKQKVLTTQNTSPSISSPGKVNLQSSLEKYGFSVLKKETDSSENDQLLKQGRIDAQNTLVSGSPVSIHTRRGLAKRKLLCQPNPAPSEVGKYHKTNPRTPTPLALPVSQPDTYHNLIMADHGEALDCSLKSTSQNLLTSLPESEKSSCQERGLNPDVQTVRVKKSTQRSPSCKENNSNLEKTLPSISSSPNLNLPYSCCIKSTPFSSNLDTNEIDNYTDKLQTTDAHKTNKGLAKKKYFTVNTDLGVKTKPGVVAQPPERQAVPDNFLEYNNQTASHPEDGSLSSRTEAVITLVKAASFTDCTGSVESYQESCLSKHFLYNKKSEVSSEASPATPEQETANDLVIINDDSDWEQDAGRELSQPAHGGVHTKRGLARRISPSGAGSLTNVCTIAGYNVQPNFLMAKKDNEAMNSCDNIDSLSSFPVCGTSDSFNPTHFDTVEGFDKSDLCSEKGSDSRRCETPSMMSSSDVSVLSQQYTSLCVVPAELKKRAEAVSRSDSCVSLETVSEPGEPGLASTPRTQQTMKFYSEMFMASKLPRPECSTRGRSLFESFPHHLTEFRNEKRTNPLGVTLQSCSVLKTDGVSQLNSDRSEGTLRLSSQDFNQHGKKRHSPAAVDVELCVQDSVILCGAMKENSSSCSQWPLTQPIHTNARTYINRPTIPLIYGQWMESAREMGFFDYAIAHAKPTESRTPTSLLLSELVQLAQCEDDGVWPQAINYLYSWLSLHPPVTSVTVKIYTEAFELTSEGSVLFNLFTNVLDKSKKKQAILLLQYFVSLFEVNFDFCLRSGNSKQIQNCMFVHWLWGDSSKVVRGGTLRHLLKLLEDVLEADNLNLTVCDATCALLNLACECLRLVSVGWDAGCPRFLSDAVLTLSHELAKRINAVPMRRKHSPRVVILNMFRPAWLKALLAAILLSDYSDYILSSPIHVKKLSLTSIVSQFFFLVPQMNTSNMYSEAGGQNRVSTSQPVTTQGEKSNSSQHKGHKKKLTTEKVNKKNSKGESAVHIACKRNKYEELEQLLSVPGVDVNLRDNCGWTPLHEACNRGNSECVEMLLKFMPVSQGSGELLRSSKVEIDAPGQDGLTPLQDAVQNNQMEVARLLLQYGGKKLLQTKSHSNITAMDLASTPEMKQLLNSFDDPSGCLDWSFSQDSSFNLQSISEIPVSQRYKEVYTSVKNPLVSRQNWDDFFQLLTVLVSSYYSTWDSLEKSGLSSEEDRQVLENMGSHLKLFRRHVRKLTTPEDFESLRCRLELFETLCLQDPSKVCI